MHLLLQMAKVLVVTLQLLPAATATQDYYPGPAWERQRQQQPAATLVAPPSSSSSQHDHDGESAAAATATASNVALWYELSAGVCVNGNPAYVFAFNEPAMKGTSETWVIQLGSSSPGLNFCIDEAHCAIFGVPMPFKKGTNMSLLPGGPFSTNCTDNPDFCDANMAVLAPECSMDLFMGNVVHSVNESHSVTPFGNVSVLHFDGLAVLQNSIAKLLSLGLSKAKRVLLTGIAHGGTAVYLHSDRIHAQIKAANPSVQFGALPVDGLHPKHWTVLYMMYKNYADSWFTAALQALGDMAFDKTASGVLPGCAKVHPGQEWKCLWVNESLPFVQAPLFAVNQMASVWDSQCILEGQQVNNVLQIGCSLNNHFERAYRTCNQYPEYCEPSFVKDVTSGFQQQYIDDYIRSGVHKKRGNGGFFHSCYLGAYHLRVISAAI
jgi:hypothetical protein